MREQRKGREVRVRVDGSLDFDQARPLYERIVAVLSDPECTTMKVDLQGLRHLDSAGAALLGYAERLAEINGKRFETEHLPAHLLPHFELAPPVPAMARTPVRRNTGDRLKSFLERAFGSLLDLATMAVDSARHVGSGASFSRNRIGTLVEQSILMGVDAVPIVALLSALVGIVLAFQGVYQLERFGADLFVAELLSLGMVREFGPLITAIIMAGRTGAAIAAELGTMSVREEIDALKALGIEPTSMLVAPRLLAITLAGPTLTALSIAVGIGAGVGAIGLLDLPTRVVFIRMREALVIADFELAFVKSLLFAWLVGLVGCFFGLHTRGGPTSVGRNTTRAVVVSIFSIVVVDSIVTTLWTVGQHD